MYLVVRYFVSWSNKIIDKVMDNMNGIVLFFIRKNYLREYINLTKTFIYKALYIHYRWYIMSNVTTIQLDKSVVGTLKKLREHPRQTYSELIKNMAKVVQKIRMRNQYDEFLHKIQQPKMRELWDNKDDGEWENA